MYRIDTLGDGSDYAGFMVMAGIPSFDAWYTHNMPFSGYPLYHTAYDGFTLYDRFLDPDYKVLRLYIPTVEIHTVYPKSRRRLL